MDFNNYKLVGRYTGEVRSPSHHQYIYKETITIFTRKGNVCWMKDGRKKFCLRPQNDNGSIDTYVSLDNFSLHDLDKLMVDILEMNKEPVFSDMIEEIRAINWPFYRGIFDVIRGKKKGREYTDNISSLFPKQ